MAVSPTRAMIRRIWRRIEASPAQSVAWRLRVLQRRVRLTAGRRLVWAGVRLGGPDVVGGREPSHSGTSWGSVPRTYTSVPPPRLVPSTWPSPPTIDRPAAIVRSLYGPVPRPPVMDLAFLEALNDEYRDKPLETQPAQGDQAGRESRAFRRLLETHYQIDLADKRVLELGCGAGFEIWYLSHHFGSEAWGVDVIERRAWAALADDRTHFVCADLAREQPFEADSFDRIISFSVFEHVAHPYAMLRELHRVLRPGGLAAISANLHRGPRASHLYRELFFPFPHLLFSDDVIRQFREKHHGVSAGASWVNRLTWPHYENYLRELGFVTHALRFSETPLDEPFYDRFGDILERYPRWDLTKDFFHVVLEKPSRRTRRTGS